ncbi:sugar ABC transporter permease [Williamsia sp. CHRR-6]|uniref:sugar ABC transporter permease n=1 Tax=Williamsia sp. CHRR-6 TaxID=2835871 RepID=UPI001BD9203D|nr:ABC transporter permease [Williamsia sp. CHRR-6]MBT0565818.1 ABC transporter permease [Williamsia sp. CHRR-6]
MTTDSDSTTTTPSDTPPPAATSPNTGLAGLQDEFRAWVVRIRGGDIGSVPAVLGMLALVVFFTVLRPDSFANKGNFANLLAQSAPYIVIAMGLVFVLLLGEIDLAAGFTAGTCAAVLAVVVTNNGFPWWVGILAAVLTGSVIGLTMGALVAFLGIPSFIVTLAWFLGLQGALLLIIGNGGTITLRDNKQIVAIANNNMTPVLGWLFVVILVGGYAAVTLLRAAARRKAGLPTQSVTLIGLKIAGLAVLFGVATAVLNTERGEVSAFVSNSLKGVPIVVAIVAGLTVLMTFVLTRTAFGRHVYAVGGNTEAARRAGISVTGIKISCFVICSSLAAFGGILLASRLSSVSPQTGGSSILLLSVAAAVIGGTSLFGGKGRVIDAVLGGLVIAIIQNGLPFITQEAGIQFTVTAAVLLLAAGVDAIARRRAAATGR